MTNKSIVSSQITYQKLDQALTTLGFIQKKTDEFTAYRETKHDALIVLPVMSDQTVVGEPHLIAIRNTVELKGVASKEKLDSLLLPTNQRRTINVPLSRVKKAEVKKKATGRKSQKIISSRKIQSEHTSV